jgi:hypothetical protein
LSLSNGQFAGPQIKEKIDSKVRSIERKSLFTAKANLWVEC